MKNGKPCVVYLSSSAHSHWREPVKAKYQNDSRVIFVGPCEEHGLSDAMGAPGDIKPGHKLRMTQMLSKSHILFGYIPDDRYRSFNIMLEIGIARAWGRRIIFVNEARSLDDEVTCALPYINESFDTLHAGLDWLDQFISGDEDATSDADAGPNVQHLVKPTDGVEHRIYLSGSQDSDWVEQVRSRYDNNNEVKLITDGGLDALANSDILLACRTDAKGRLFDLCLAIGYATALSKRIIFVNEGDHYSHAYDYAKPFADGYFTQLSDGLRYLDYTVGIEDRLT